MNKDELGKRIKKYSKFHDSKFYNHLKAALVKFLCCGLGKRYPICLIS